MGNWTKIEITNETTGENLFSDEGGKRVSFTPNDHEYFVVEKLQERIDDGEIQLSDSHIVYVVCKDDYDTISGKLSWGDWKKHYPQ